MKETGVVRRIDELGRIVIPKEIRRRFQIDNGDLVDIFIENSHIILKKFHPLEEIAVTVQNLLDSVTHNIDSKIIITDKYQIIASTEKSILEGTPVSAEFQKRINEHVDTEGSKALNFKVTDGYTITDDFYAKEIRINSELFGYVLVLDNIVSKRTKELADIIIKFLSLSMS